MITHPTAVRRVGWLHLAVTTKGISYLTFGSFATDEALTHMTA